MADQKQSATPAAGKSETASDEEQVKLLEEAKTQVKTQAFYMKRCLDAGNLMDALKHASNMISELRTSLLSPKNYYALYIEASDHLRYLETYLLEGKHGKRMAELYELVQYAGNILPRLYLLVTVGSAYIKLKEAPAKDVLRDLVEMCRGVQHPTRGLFLRTYLSEMTKDKLPDIGTEYEGRGGGPKEAIDFILQNFIEMNKLWVRMQHQGPMREKTKRENERSELRLLIGKNIARLSQLEGVDLSAYTRVVLPRLLEQIVNCRDVLAQQYLMECVIQVFPDEYHLRTLDSLLATISQLQSGVNIKTILVSLIDRLAAFASRESIPSDIDIFKIFSNQISQIVQQHSTASVEDILSLESSLLSLVLAIYGERMEYVDSIFEFTNNFLSSRPKEEYSKNACVKIVVRILNIPVEYYKSILTVLKLNNYSNLLNYLNFNDRKKVAIETVKNTIEFSPAITDAVQVEKLLNFIRPLVKDEEDQVGEVDPDDFNEEQNLVASLIHLFQSEDVESLFAMYLAARKFFGQGGTERVKHTLVPLLFGSLRLALRLKGNESSDSDWTTKAKKVFKFSHETTFALSRANKPDLALRLFLSCATAASKCGAMFETIAYEFVTQAFIIYEEQISESTAQVAAIQMIIGTLHGIDIFTEENYDTLITKTALHSSKLLKKPDQCRAVLMSSHLFWSPQKGYKNGKRVLECLQKCLKIADTCVDTSINLHLFVEILNEYLFYFENRNESVIVQYLNGLIELIRTNISNLENQEASSQAIQSFNNTLNFIRWKQNSSDERYQQIDIKK